MSVALDATRRTAALLLMIAIFAISGGTWARALGRQRQVGHCPTLRQYLARIDRGAELSRYDRSRAWGAAAEDELK
jgi:hypothetical protein